MMNYDIKSDYMFMNSMGSNTKKDKKKNNEKKNRRR